MAHYHLTDFLGRPAPIPLSIREQELQISQSETLGELLLPQDIFSQRRFLLLQRPNLFLDAVLDQQTVGNHLIDLASFYGVFFSAVFFLVLITGDASALLIS